MNDLERGALLVKREKLEFTIKDLKAALSSVGTAMQLVGTELKDHPDALANAKPEVEGVRSNVRGRSEWNALPEKNVIAQQLHDLHEACNALYEVNSKLGTP